MNRKERADEKMDKYLLLKTIEMPDEAVEVIRNIDLRIESNGSMRREYEKIRKDFFNDEDVRSAIAALSNKIGVHEYETALWFFASCSDETERRMIAQGHSEKVFTDSMRDLMIWAKFSKKSYGVWGIREFVWISNTVRARLWRLGRLQFERIVYEYDDFSFGGYNLRTGDTVINVHISAYGPFPADARLDYYKRAHDYFGMDTFMCESYLLYPTQEKYLDPKSNIVSFLNEYHIVKSGAAGSLYNLRYLYGDMDHYDIATLARDTSLRRSVLRMIEETGDMGWGVGVLFFNGTEII